MTPDQLLLTERLLRVRGGLTHGSAIPLIKPSAVQISEPLLRKKTIDTAS